MTRAIRLKNPNIGMHVEEIKAAIRMKGHTITSLSKSWNLDRTAISKTLAQPWPEVELRIANFLDKKPQDIWPTRYNLNGSPKTGHHFRKKNTTIVHVRNNQLRKAA
jgi:Ner family transcriptional regulator